jgi:hypothetical protein
VGGLTARQETFARLFAECGVATDAYAAAYDTEPSTSRHTVRVNAYRLLRVPKVARRVRELQQAASERTLMSAAELIADLEAMATADVNEIMSLTVGACRYCHGEGGHYQWRDNAELARAIERYRASLDTRTPLPAPDASGGFGYRGDREPNAECGQCDGAGVPRVRFANTADVSPGSRKLYRGIELYQDGTVKRVLLNDPLAVRLELHRVRGMHIDRSMSVTAHVNVPALKDMTHEQALDFLDSLRPAR